LLPALNAQGLTQAHVDQVEQYVEDFDLVWDAQDKAIENRDTAVQARIAAGNALYKEMVELADLGKRIWLNVDGSKYNEYVLYPNQGAGPGEQEPPAQQVVESDVAPMAVVSLSVTEIDGTEAIKVFNDGPTKLTVYFAAMPTDMPSILPPAIAVNVDAGMEWNGTVAGLGHDPMARTYLNVYNETPMLGHVQVTVAG
ncbi:MAG: hypothetical protein K9J06_10905, partial [Flavobacteriales bacterium]|nr:hypothetical protein [Flavobacteriales bacterium]